MNKSVLKKLFSEKEQSVELSEVQVDLALIDEIQKLQVSANNSSDKALNELKKGIATLDNAIKIYDTAISESQKVLQQIEKAQVISKDLGVELPANINAVYKSYQNNIKEYNAYKNDITSFKSKMF